MPNEQNSAVTRKNVLSSLGWSYAEKISLQVTSFVISIILARLLTPEDYGTLALVNIFITIMSAIALTGFGTALVQKKEAEDIDFSTTLIFSFGVSVIAYLVLFLAAPLISYLMSENITPYLRVASLSLIFSSIYSVLYAYVVRKLQFHKIFLASIIGVIASAVVGICMAYNGFGVWALVAQHLTSIIVKVIVSIFICGWKLKFVFSTTSLREVYGFSWKIVAASVLNAFYNQLRSLAIGKKYTTTDLAYYDRGNQYPTLVVNNIDDSIASVLTPTLSRKQDDLSGLTRIVRRGVKTSSLVLFPLLIGLAVCAEPIVVLMLTEKWLPCVPYLQILSIALMLKPIQTASLQGIIAMGRGDVYLKIHMLQKILGVIIILVTIFCFDSVFWVALGELIGYILFACVSVYPNVKYLKYGIIEQITDIAPQLIVALLMGVVVYLVGLLEINMLLLLILQVLSGMVFYITAMRLLKLDAFMYLWNVIINGVKKLKNKK